MVHQKLATTEIRGEKPTGIDIELPKIFEDSNSMLANDIANFFKDVNRDAPSRIQKVIALQCLSAKSFLNRANARKPPPVH